MQNSQQKKTNGNEPFAKVFLSTLVNVGNALIIVFGALYFGIRKIFFLLTKKKDNLSFGQFVKNLERQMKGQQAGRAFARSKKTKPAKAKPVKVKPADTKPVEEKSVEENKSTAPEPAKKSTEYTPINPRQASSASKYIKKKPALIRHLPKIAMALMAAGVVVSAIFIFKALAGNNEETDLKESETASVGLAENSEEDPFENLKIFEASSSPVKLEMAGTLETSEKETENSAGETEEPTPSLPETSQDKSAFLADKLNPELMIHKKDTNELVPMIQEQLMDLHYMDADEPTDYYGEMTWYGISLFQRGHGLMVDGVAGYETLTLLFSDEATPYLVRKGDHGTDIAKIKERLAELGYLDTDNDDKNFDEDTDYAVRVFQGRNKLSQDGIVGYNTTQVLFNGDAKPAKSYKPPSNDNTGGGGSSDGGSYNPNDANALVSYAKAQMNKGYTYIWGGKGPPGMDCSGFVYYCLKQTGNGIGYMTSAAWAQSSYTSISSIHDAKPGDILCFEGHVAICIGGGKMIDSSSSSNAIRIANYESSNYWNRKWKCAKRVFP